MSRASDATISSVAAAASLCSSRAAGLEGREQHVRFRARARGGRRRRRRVAGTQAKGVHRLVDVLDLLLALVVEGGAHLVAHGAAHRVRHRDAAGLRERLQARRDVHAVAIDGAVGLLDDVAHVHADAKEHAALLGQRGGLVAERPLDREGRAHRAGGRVEDGEDRIAGHVDDASFVAFDLLAKDGARVVEGGDGRAIIGGHEAGVRRGIGGEDRREPLPECASTHPSVAPEAELRAILPVTRALP